MSWLAKVWTGISRAGTLAYFGYEMGRSKEVKVILEKPKVEQKPNEEDISLDKDIWFFIVIVLVVLVAILATRIFIRRKPKVEQIQLREREL